MATSDKPEFFNFHAKGVAYLNRAREVEVENGDPYLSCTLAVLTGPKSKVKYRYVDCRVVGEKAEELVQKYLSIINDEDRKVLAGCRIGDLWTDAFIFQKGPKQGKPGANLKGRLLFLEWIKIDGQYVYVSAESESASAKADVKRQASSSNRPSPTTTGTSTTAIEATAAA